MQDNNSNNHYHQCYTGQPVLAGTSSSVLSVQSFTARMPLLTATSTLQDK